MSGISFCKYFIGERAIRDILKQARAVGEASEDPRINKVCTELEQLMDNLATYRARGQVIRSMQCYFVRQDRINNCYLVYKEFVCVFHLLIENTIVLDQMIYDECTMHFQDG